MKAKTVFLIVMLLMSAIFGALEFGLQSPIPVDGDVWSLQPGTTFNIIQRAIAGQPGTTILAKGNMYVFSAPVGSGVKGIGFTGVNMNLEVIEGIMKKGNYINGQTWTDLANNLKENGWKRILPAEVPMVLRFVSQYRFAWMAYVSAHNVSMFVVPAVMLQPIPTSKEIIQ